MLYFYYFTAVVILNYLYSLTSAVYVLAECVELLQCHMSAITTTKTLTVWIISA